MDINAELMGQINDLQQLREHVEQAFGELGYERTDTLTAWLEPRVQAMRTDVKQLVLTVKRLRWSAIEAKRQAQQQALNLDVAALLAESETPLAPVDSIPVAVAVAEPTAKRR